MKRHTWKLLKKTWLYDAASSPYSTLILPRERVRMLNLSIFLFSENIHGCCWLVNVKTKKKKIITKTLKQQMLFRTPVLCSFFASLFYILFYLLTEKRKTRWRRGLTGLFGLTSTFGLAGVWHGCLIWLLHSVWQGFDKVVWFDHGLTGNFTELFDLIHTCLLSSIRTKRRILAFVIPVKTPTVKMAAFMKLNRDIPLGAGVAHRRRMRCGVRSLFPDHIVLVSIPHWASVFY